VRAGAVTTCGWQASCGPQPADALAQASRPRSSSWRSLAAIGEGTPPRVDQLCRGQDGMTSPERINLEPSVVLLHAYLDGELSVSESAEAERKIAADDGLAAEAAAVRALKRALRTQLLPETLPPDFSSRIARRIGLSRPRCRPTWMLLAASVMLSIGFSSAVTSVRAARRRRSDLRGECRQPSARAD
jgi:hypothetical protein